MADLASPNELVPVRSAAPIKARIAPAGSFLERLRGLAEQPAVARAAPMLAVLAAVAAALGLWLMLHQPPQRQLFGGLADADKQAVAEALGAAGIKYSIDGGSGALEVDDSKFYQAKMLLAAQGLPKAAPSGEDMLGSLPMGASRAMEGERLRASREADLARTIEAIDAVETARVHLAVTEPSVFLRDEQKSAASVMLKLRGGRTLSDAQVQAIVHLVASSVPGLSPDQVSVVDQSGRLLSASGAADAQGGDKQIALQGRIEERYRTALTQLLTPIVGEGNFTAEVHADLAFDEVAATRESYPKDTAVVRSEQGSWANKDGAAGTAPAVGIPGTLSNTAPPASQVAVAPNGAVTPGTPAGEAGKQAAGKTEESYNRTFDVGREVSVTRQATGTVKRLSVAVALKNPAGGKPRPAAETAAIEALVKGAVGYDQQRGDVVAVSARTFADPVEAAPAWYDPAKYENSVLPAVLRNVGAIAAAAIVVFGLVRPLMKKRAAAAVERKAAEGERRALLGKDLATAIADHNAVDPDQTVTLQMIERAPSYAARAALIRNFVKQDPDRAALVVRDLIRADAPAPAEA